MSKLSVCLLLALAAEGLVMSLASHALGCGNALLLLAGSMILGMVIISGRRKKLDPAARPADLLHLLYLSLVCALFVFPGLISDVLGYLLLLPGVLHPAERLLQGRLSGLQAGAFTGDNFYARFFGFDNFSSSMPGSGGGGGKSGHNVVDAEYTVVDEETPLPRPQAEAPPSGRGRQPRT